MNKIESKIVGWKIITPEAKAEREKATIPVTPVLSWDTPRDEILTGYTYKLKVAPDAHAWYVTINNIDVGGVTSPYEIFISTKDMVLFEWTSTVTRLISAVFRRGGDVSFLVEELLAIHNPSGGYWGNNHESSKKRYYNSVLNELGVIIKLHLDHLNPPKVVKESLTTLVLDSKLDEIAVEDVKYPDNATVCPECKVKAVVKLDGCDTCLSCGAGKCS